jgi:nitroreductase
MTIDIAAADALLTTTRGVRRRLDFDKPVDPKVLRDCIEIALQAPVGSPAWPRHFIVVTEAAKRKGIADLYRKACIPYIDSREALADSLEDESEATMIRRNLALARTQAETIERNPALVILAIEGRVEDGALFDQASMYGSLLPAAWSLMLTLRARGLGSCWTTLHLKYERETAAYLGIPPNYSQGVLLPIAHFVGTGFKPAKRLPVDEQIHWNKWGQH